MASRKRKATTSIPQARYNRSRFTSQEAWDHYTDNVKLYVTEFDEFRRELERRN